MSQPSHHERKHSKYSASAAERWFSCSGSVALSEGQPDKSSPYAEEGTRAHEILEKLLTQNGISGQGEMYRYAADAARFIRSLHWKHPYSELMVEKRVLLDFIHPEAFGSLDAAIVDYFGTLHILDFKYGMTLVSPKENLQFIFYALAVAHSHHWNFSSVRMWTLQPRVRGFDGYTFWEISIEELRKYVPKFQAAVSRVEKYPDTYTEGAWCHFCKAKAVCPLKREAKREKLAQAFN